MVLEIIGEITMFLLLLIRSLQNASWPTPNLLDLRANTSYPYQNMTTLYNPLQFLQDPSFLYSPPAVDVSLQLGFWTFLAWGFLVGESQTVHRVQCWRKIEPPIDRLGQ